MRKLSLLAKAVGKLSRWAGAPCGQRLRRSRSSRCFRIASETSLEKEKTSARNESNLVTIRTHCDARDGLQTGRGKVRDFLPGPIRFLSHEQLCFFRHQEITRRSPGIILNAAERLGDRGHLPRPEIVRFDHPFLIGNLMHETKLVLMGNATKYSAGILRDCFRFFGSRVHELQSVRLAQDEKRERVIVDL